LESIKQSIDVLEQFGHIAININNFSKYNIVDKLINDVSRLCDVHFIGIIYDHECRTSIYQPIIIWQKIIGFN